jgi:hypothetical protein
MTCPWSDHNGLKIIRKGQFLRSKVGPELNLLTPVQLDTIGFSFNSTLKIHS